MKEKVLPEARVDGHKKIKMNAYVLYADTHIHKGQRFCGKVRNRGSGTVWV